MSERQKIKALLIDIGGPIIDETACFIDGMEFIRTQINRNTSLNVTLEDVIRTREKMISCWAPSLTKAIIWQYLQPDVELTRIVYREAWRFILGSVSVNSIQPGVIETIPKLAEGYLLALAANQPATVKSTLEKSGILKFFKSSLVSEDLKLYKPDSRFFLKICELLSVRPSECVMIGDRRDNDIYPANILGMKTIMFDVGEHRLQESRVPEDEPDARVTKFSEIINVLERWEKEDGSEN